VRVHGFLNSLRVQGLRVYRLQVLDTMEGVLGLMPACPSPAGRSRGPLARRFDSASLLREEKATAESRSGGHRIPTRVCLRVTTERQMSIRFGEGSSRTEKVHGESASSALNKAPVSEVRRVGIG